MNVRCLSLLAASICLIAALPTVPASGITIRAPYEGAAAFAFSNVAEECGSSLPRSLGVACFNIPKGAASGSFQVIDASRLAVGGTWYAYNGDTFLGSGTHCNGANVPVTGASVLVVRLEAIGGPLNCAAHTLGAGEATKGVVNVQITKA